MTLKIKSQTYKKVTLTQVIIILFSVMVAGSIAGCSQSLKIIPEELRGKYVTNDPEYKEHYFELSPGFITLRFSGEKFKYYEVKRVEKEVIENKILYTILCANEDEGEEFNFAFFTGSASEGIIHFKNKPQVAWQKQETEISYNDNSDTQIRH